MSRFNCVCHQHLNYIILEVPTQTPTIKHSNFKPPFFKKWWTSSNSSYCVTEGENMAQRWLKNKQKYTRGHIKTCNVLLDQLRPITHMNHYLLIRNIRREVGAMCVPLAPPQHAPCARYSILMPHQPWKTCNYHNHDNTVDSPGTFWYMSHGSTSFAIVKTAKFLSR